MICIRIKQILLSFVFILTYSCTADGTSGESDNEPSIIKVNDLFADDVEENLVVEFEYKVNADDSFELFYVERDSESRFSEENKISKKVYKDVKFNKLSFNLPRGYFPGKLRLDLGSNKKQEKITINQITVKNSENEIIIDNELLPFFFVVNNFLVYDSEYGEFTTKSVNGRYDPFLVSTPLLIQKIKLEL